MNFFKDKEDENLYELDASIRNILLSYGPIEETAARYRFKCVMCGDNDSGISTKKRRGYILKSKTPWVYYCQNCGYKRSAVMWLKDEHNIEYQAYRRRIFSGKKTNTDDALFHTIHDESVKAAKVKDLADDQKDREYFRVIEQSDNPIIQSAYDYVTGRKIPEGAWSKYFVSIGGRYKNRIIIPYYNHNDAVYYFNSRDMGNSPVKYLFARYINPKYFNIYKYYQVDKSEMVSVVEGHIDSEFVENCVAVGGIKPNIPGLDTIKNKIFVLDYDKAGVEGSVELLKRGETVFSWGKFLVDNGMPTNRKWDINEVVLFLGTNMIASDTISKYSVRGKGYIAEIEMFFRMNRI